LSIYLLKITPRLFGKMSTQKKIKRQIKELKYNFYGISQFAIKEEVCPLILSYVSNNLINEGKVFNNFIYI